MLRDKVKGLDELEKILSQSRTQQTRVFTNGCFDILHPGHVRYLERARAMGDLLVVGVNSDRSVACVKGSGRPLMREAERAELVAALEPVDYVVIFDEDTPEALIRRLRPDVHVKGGDYETERLPEAEAVRDGGGRVEIVDLIPGYSTTGLVKRIVGDAAKRAHAERGGHPGGHTDGSGQSDGSGGPAERGGQPGGRVGRRRGEPAE